MTDYAVTVKRRKANKLEGSIRAHQYVYYEGFGANNNHFVQLWLRSDGTLAANNDTVTLTLG